MSRFVSSLLLFSVILTSFCPALASRRNYASKECGSKVLVANEEAENRGAVLNEKEDEYMRNPCEKATQKYLIIELCETVQPTEIEIADYELFSSSLKDFRLMATERYPTAAWSQLGEFTAQDARGVQSFTIEHTTYAKFIRLELLSHYGKEHFCTLSSVRVYGISMVDEYEEVAKAAANIASIESVPPTIEPLFPDSLLNEPLFTTPELSSAIVERSAPLHFWQLRGCFQCPRDRSVVTSWFCHAFSPNTRRPRPRRPSSQLQFLKAIKIPPLVNVCFPTATKLGESVQLHAGNQAVNASPPIVKVVDPVTLPPAVTVEDTDKHGRNLKSATIPLPAGTTSHKESIFIKLNKRITSLEVNVSLTNQYLTELSHQYIAHSKETRKYHERTGKAINDSIAKASKELKKIFADQLFGIRNELSDLSRRVNRMNTGWSNFLVTRSILDSNVETSTTSSLVVHEPAGENCGEDCENIYLDKSDGLWTTAQLVVMLAAMQCTSFIFIFLFYYIRVERVSQRNNPVLLSSVDDQIRELIKSEVERELTARQQKPIETHPSESSGNGDVAVSSPSTLSSSPAAVSPTSTTMQGDVNAAGTATSKRRKKKKRNQSNAQGNMDPWDSVSISSNCSAPSVQVSEEANSHNGSSKLCKKPSTGSRDSCFVSDGAENVIPEQPNRSPLKETSALQNGYHRINGLSSIRP